MGMYGGCRCRGVRLRRTSRGAALGYALRDPAFQLSIPEQLEAGIFKQLRVKMAASNLQPITSDYAAG